MKPHQLLIVLLFWVCNSMAQTYPVRSITTVAAPYPVSLDQFANSENGKINLSLIPTDASMQNYQVKLRLFIVGNGYKIYSDPNYASRSILLNHGETQMFTGPELAAWFNPDNLIFEGISKSQYQKTGRLPEGMVQVWFETWDFYRNFNISGTSKAMVWLFENQPPTLTFPVDKKEFLYADPQNITFNWMPGQSPFSVAGLTNEYKFELWEIWPDNLTADAVVQTTHPIYTTTQTTTTLQYGTDCPILQTGRRYAWRIQAYDSEGKKQYKNNGYSVVRSFRFGRDCGMPEFKIDKVTTTKATLLWNTDTRYTAYTLRYRNKNKTNANWYEQTGTTVGGTIEKLQPATQYEIQLQATCYEQQGKWSTSIDLTTAQELSFNCGASGSSVDLSDNAPLPTLLHNEYFKAYDFDIEVDEVSGANGRFSGTGYARVPLLNFVKFRVHFSGISINSSYRMTSGNVTFDYDESNGMSFDLSGVLSSIGVGATAESNPFTSIIPNQLSTAEAQATNITFDNNTVVVRQSDGNTVTKTATSSTPFVAVTSTKPGSDSYVADASSGTVYKASSDPSTANGGSLQQPKASDKALSYAVSFAPHVRQRYGFDLPGEKHPEGNYKTQSIGGTDVLIPWKSVEAGQVDRVMATLGAKADTAIHFITQSGNMVMVAAGDKSNLQIPVSNTSNSFKQLLIAGTEDNDQLRAWYTAPGDTTKKPERVLAAVANVVAYDKQTAPVYIIEINGAVAPDASYIQTYLNTVYAPAIANFTVSKKAFTTSITSPFDNTVTDKMGYNKVQDALIKAFKDSVIIDKKALYLFFIKENTTHSDIKGHMPFNRQFGFIYASNQSITELTRTMAHELGHGAFRLKHTFSNENEFVQNQGQTPNIMDYASGSELLKYQWDECHDFDLGCNWFEDGDEAESNVSAQALFLNTIDLRKQGFTENVNFITPGGQIITLPSNAVVSFTGKTNTEVDTKLALGPLTMFNDGVDVYVSIFVSVNGEWKFVGYQGEITQKWFDDTPESANLHTVLIGKEDNNCQLTLTSGNYEGKSYKHTPNNDPKILTESIVLGNAKTIEPTIALVKCTKTSITSTKAKAFKVYCNAHIKEADAIVNSATQQIQKMGALYDDYEKIALSANPYANWVNSKENVIAFNNALLDYYNKHKDAPKVNNPNCTDCPKNPINGDFYWDKAGRNWVFMENKWVDFSGEFCTEGCNNDWKKNLTTEKIQEIHSEFYNAKLQLLQNDNMQKSFGIDEKLKTNLWRATQIITVHYLKEKWAVDQVGDSYWNLLFGNAKSVIAKISVANGDKTFYVEAALDGVFFAADVFMLADIAANVVWKVGMKYLIIEGGAKKIGQHAYYSVCKKAVALRLSYILRFGTPEATTFFNKQLTKTIEIYDISASRYIKFDPATGETFTGKLASADSKTITFESFEKKAVPAGLNDEETAKFLIKDLAKTGGKTVTRTLNAVADAKIIDRVKVLRQKLTSNFKKSGNFGWAEAEVTGLSKSEFYAHSSIDELTGTLPERVPEISLKPKNKIYPSTKEPNIIGEPIDRVVDSEYKILTEITEKLGSNFDATGKITLFTEREPCNSCKNVINLFCKRYPKIEVEVIHNNGKMLIDF